MFPNLTSPRDPDELSEIHRWAQWEGKSAETVADLQRQTQLASPRPRIHGWIVWASARAVELWLAVRES